MAHTSMNTQGAMIFPKGAADDNADREVDDVAAHDEGLDAFSISRFSFGREPAR